MLRLRPTLLFLAVLGLFSSLAFGFSLRHVNTKTHGRQISFPSTYLYQKYSSLKNPRSVHTKLSETKNNLGITEMSEFQRKDLWKSISKLEKDAVKKLSQSGSIESPESDATIELAEVHKLFAQSTILKNSDPYVQLARKYALAVDDKDEALCEQIIQAMNKIGVPPHVNSLAKRESTRSSLTDVAKQGEEGTEIRNGEGDGDSNCVPEEVDAGSTFSDTTTDQVRVKVNSFYDAARSDPAEGRFMFYYKVAIFNEGSEAVQVVARQWEILKCRGDKETVRGTGIMGTQPVIPPGEVFHYESACPLRVFPPRGKRVLGSMEGAYTLCRGNMGQYNFSARVSRFNLILPLSAMTSVDNEGL